MNGWATWELTLNTTEKRAIIIILCCAIGPGRKEQQQQPEAPALWFLFLKKLTQMYLSITEPGESIFPCIARYTLAADRGAYFLTSLFVF